MQCHYDKYRNAEFRYAEVAAHNNIAECHSDECHYAYCRGTVPKV